MTNNKPLMELSNVKVHFPVTKGLLRKVVGHVRAVDGVSFAINPGETVGLVGESGCGKTTLGRAILRLVPATDGRIVYNRSDAASPGKTTPVNLLDLDDDGLKPIRKEISAIFQDPYSSLNPRMTVADIIGEPLKIQRYPVSQRRDRAAELLERVGLSSTYMNRYPHEFSGGQRQRISVARSLALNPKLVICDEPVSALDVSVQAQILNLMADLQEEFDLTYLLVSHNLSVVQYVSHRIAVMYLGKVVELTEAKRLYTDPLHPYTEALLSAIPIADTEAKKEKIRLEGSVPSPINPPSGCHFHPRCRYSTPECAQTEPQLQERGDGHWVACLRAEELDLRGIYYQSPPAV